MATKSNKSNSSYVFSTLANDQLYQNWEQGGGDVPIKGHGVFIKGGTGVANDRLITPIGVATEVSDFDLSELEKNVVFGKHRDAGFIVVRAKSADVEKVASDMNLKDESAPLTESDYSAEDAPKTAIA